MKDGIKESNISGIANQDIPESCVVGREANIEALAGADAGRVLSHEIITSECRRCWVTRKALCSKAVSQALRVTQRGHRPYARIEPSCTRTGRSHHLLPQLAWPDASESLKTYPEDVR